MIEVEALPDPVDVPVAHTVAVRATAAWVTTMLMLLMVTKGPVFWIRRESAGVAGDFIDDVWVQWAFLASAALVIVVAWPAWRAVWRDRLVVTVFAVFLGVILASTLWSVVTARTFPQAAMMLLGTTAALFAGASVDRLALLVALWTAMQVGVVASIWADLRDWQLSLDLNGDLAGIYFNRNSLGPVALIGAVTTIVLIVVVLRRRDPWRVPVAVGLVLAGVADLTVWDLSGSLTPVVGVLLAAVGCAVLSLLAPGRRRRLRQRLAAVVIAAVAGAAALAVATRDSLAERLDRSSTFSGRTTIWDVVVDFAGDRPIQGWGFMAVWRKPAIIDALAARDRIVYEAHSGYLEVLVGAGIIGLFALVAVVAFALQRTGRAAWCRPDVVLLSWFGLVLYTLGVNIGETYIGANLLPWILLAMATAVGSTELQRRAHDAIRITAEVPVVGTAVAEDAVAEAVVAEIGMAT